MNNAHIREDLLAILACPACDNRPKVRVTDEGIHCDQCGRVYPIENGVPIMLVDRATVAKQTGDA